MPVPAANVLISFTKDAMDAYLEARHVNFEDPEEAADGTTFPAGGAMAPVSDEHPDVFTFSNATVEEGANLQVLEFIHQYAYSDGVNMRIKLVDPSRQFEKRILAQNVGEDLASYAINYTGEAAHRKPDPNYQHKIQNADSLMKKLNELVPPQGQEIIAKEIERLEKVKTENNTKVLYVMYGLGSNPHSWSGPHAMTLSWAELLPEQGSRQIRLNLAGIPNSVSPTHRKNSYGKDTSMDSSNLLISGFSKRFEGVFSRSFTPGKGFSPALSEPRGIGIEDSGIFYGPKQPNDSINPKAREGSRLQKEFSLVQEFSQFVDLHLVVTDVIKDFVAKATGNPSVIVLLPNLNFILGPLFYKILQEVDWHSSYQRYEKATFVKKTMAAVDKILKELSINLQKYPAIIKDRVPISRSVTAGKIARFADPEFVIPDPYHTDFWATVHSTHSDSEHGISLSPKTKLKNIFDMINYHSIERFTGVYNVVAETDTAIIDLWRSLGDLGTTEAEQDLGYSTPNKTFESLIDQGLSKKITNPAVLVGSLSMINNFLYGKRELSAQYLEDVTSELQGTKPEDLPSPMAPFDSSKVAYSTAPAILRGFAHYPLHPCDKVLGDLGNNEKIRNYLAGRHARESMFFGETQKLPDEFAFIKTDEGKEAANIINRAGIPIFKYNTTNPNVLSIKASYNPAYWSQLAQLNPLTHFTRISSSRTTTATSPPAPVHATPQEIHARATVNMSQRGLNTKELGELIQEAMQQSTSNPEMRKAFTGSLLMRELALLTTAWQLSTANNPLNITIKVSQGSGKEAVSYAWMNFLTKLYQSVKQVNLTTLPMFYYSHGNMIHQECALFSQFPQIRQTTEPEYSALDSFLSGIYVIVGFRHTISNKSAYSEFKLAKNS